MNKVLEERNKKVSLALRLVDAFSESTPIGKIAVSLKDQTYKPIRNSSGHFVFVDLPVEKYIVQVEGELYFYDNTSQQNEVDLKALEPKNPTKELPLLKPTPDYPFPPSTTLIRGKVLCAITLKPAKDVTVEIDGQTADKKTVSTQTTSKGEFALYFPTLKGEDVETSGQTRYVKIGNSKKLTLKITKNNAHTTKTVENVIEGRTTSIQQAIELNISC
jgi:hypothetical protein